MGRLTSILIVAILCGGGCRESKGPPASSGKETGETIEQWLEVVADSAQIKQARRLSDRLEAERFDAVCAAPHEMFVDRELIGLLQARQEEAVDRLRISLRDGMSEKSVAAAILLCHLGDQEGMLHLRGVLASGSAHLRTRLMDGLSWPRETLLELSKDDRFCTLLLTQLDDPEPAVAKAAVQACGIMKVPGAAAKFAELIHKPDMPDKSRLFYWLSQLDPRPEHVETLVALLDEVDSDAFEGRRIQSVLDFAESDDADTARRACEVLRELVKQPATETDMYESYQRQRAIALLVEHAGQDEVPWLDSLRDEELPSYVQAAVLGALARVEGESGRQRLLAALDDPDLRSDVAREIGRCFRETADNHAVVRLKAAAGREDRTNVLAAIAEALLAVGGEEAGEAAVKLANRLDGSSKMRVLWQAYGLSAETVTDKVVESGLIDRAAYLKAIHEIKESPDYDPKSSIYLESVLGQAGIVVVFDVETGELPCRHDLLLLDFAQVSQGIFTPRAVSQQWHTTNDEDWEADYTLQFVFDGRLYRARLQNFGDWYDVERLVTAINVALANAGKEERFVAEESEGQVAWFLFGKPQALQKLAEELYLPLGEDLNRAMRLGKEFEQMVIQSLDKDKSE